MSLNDHAHVWNQIVETKDEKTNKGKTNEIFIKLSISIGLEGAKYHTIPI